MSDLTIATLSRAMDGLHARQAATAHNIANSGNVNFTPMRVTFEDALQAALKSDAPLQAISQLKSPAVHSAPQDGEMRLDLELTLANETASRYAMLTSIADRNFQMQSLAFKGTP